MSADGHQARDVMLSLMKTCRKLGISCRVALNSETRRVCRTFLPLNMRFDA